MTLRRFALFSAAVCAALTFTFNAGSLSATLAQTPAPLPPIIGSGSTTPPPVTSPIAPPPLRDPGSTAPDAGTAATPNLNRDGPPSMVGQTPSATSATAPADQRPIKAPPIALDPNRSFHFNNRFYPPSGSFNAPFMLSYDRVNAELYVSDYTNNRLLVYNDGGTFLRQYTANMNGPGGVVVIGNAVYVADCGFGRVNIYDRASTAFSTSIGSGYGCPSGMALHPIDGNLYIVETSAHRVRKLATSGTDQGTFGSQGSGNGQLNTPYGLAIDPNGYIFVADTNNNRVAKFYTGGAFARNIGSLGSAIGQLNYPLAVAIDKAGLLYVTDVNNYRIQRFDLIGTYRGQYYAPNTVLCGGQFGTTCNGGFFALRGITVNNIGQVYTSDAGNATLQKFDPALHPTGRYSAQAWGGSGAGNGQFNRVGGIAVDDEENIYATDYNNHRVQKFDKFGALITIWGAFGGGNGQFNQPYGITFEPLSKTILVADSSNHRVQKFNKSGAYLGQFGSLGSGNGQFTYSSGIAADDFGYVYVTDENNHRVQKFDASNGVFQRKWGSFGAGNGQFNIPTGIAVDSVRGMVYVVDFTNRRLQMFTLYGDFVKVFGSLTGGCFPLNPIGVAADERGNVIVADRGNNRLLLANESDQCLNTMGSNNVQAVGFSPNGTLITGGGSADHIIRRVGAPNPRFDTIGVFRPSNQTFYLRSVNTQGFADITGTVSGANSSDLPVAGDWNGDGIATVGLYRPSNSGFYLWDSLLSPNIFAPGYSLVLGNPGDRPMAGDWNADGRDSVGTYRPSNGILYLRNALTTGFADYAMILGNPSDFGVAGDWDGDGIDSAGIFRPSEARFYLSDRNTNGVIFGDYRAYLGNPGDTPFAGDWIHQGSSGLGVFRPSNGFLYLKNALADGFADVGIFFGSAGDLPIGGQWGVIPNSPDAPPDAGPQPALPVRKPYPPNIIVAGPQPPIITGVDENRID